MIKGRDLLVYLSVKYKGNWDEMYQAIQQREKVSFEEVDEALKNNKANYITCVDSEYPDCLKGVYHPPFVLYYYGDISLINNKDIRKLAVIGSRSPSDYGIKATKAFVTELAKQVIVVSGLAKGIDTVALKNAIDNNGKVVAILGSGIERCYPSENKELFEVIKQSHLLISEYPLDTPPNDFQFPFRNRLVAALSDAVLVAEAKHRSGTLITVGHALSLGKDIFCIPHRIGESSSSNTLIKDGAYLAESAEDILTTLKPSQK